MIDKTKTSWLQRNIDRMMKDVMQDIRYGRPKPYSIMCSREAFRAIGEVLKSRTAYFPRPDGTLNFLGIPIKINLNLPAGTFSVERFALPVSLSQGYKR